MEKHRNTEIHVIDNGHEPQIELKGDINHLLIAWGWLTLSICERWGISAERLAVKMPWVVGTLRGALRGRTTIDLGALEKLQREKGDGHDHDG